MAGGPVLSDRDQRTLADIERRLGASDPGLVRRFESAHVRPEYRPLRAWHYCAAVLGALLAVIGFAFGYGPVLVLCCAALVAGGMACRGLRHWRRERVSRRHVGEGEHG
jgi:DUF3040 family protein